MQLVFALIGVVAAVAGIVQTIVVLIERSERKRLARTPSVAREIAARPVGKHARGDDLEAHEVTSSQMNPFLPAPWKWEFEYEPLFGEQPPIDPVRFGTSWRSCLALLFGWIGALFFWRNPRPEVRFQAAQSLWIDVAAIIYFILSLFALVPYVAIRYPGDTNGTISSTDPAVTVWAVSFLVGPFVLHLLLACIVLFGKNPRVPLIWKIAATVTARQNRRTRDAARLHGQNT